MKGYKAFHKGLTAYGGFQYEIGREYVITGKLRMCNNGFHFCKNLIDVFGYYDFDERNVEIAEVEASGEIINEGTKFCAERIKIIKTIPWIDVYDSIKDGKHNSGDCNSGSYNSGNCNSGSHNSGYGNTGYHNSGDYNTGNYNSGNRNSGDCNSGSRNSGDYNTGNYNSGNRNSGDCNSGSRNSGDCNSGSYNSGNYNSGNRNSGYCNSGSRNSGDYNSGNDNSGSYNSGSCNSGYFNTNTPTIRLFNKDSGMTFEEFSRLRINMNDLENNKAIIQNLPNFDAQVFYEATGIDWRAEVKDD